MGSSKKRCYKRRLDIYETLVLLVDLHKLIKEKRTGNIATLCTLFGQTYSGIGRRLDQLRDMGAEIGFDRNIQSYYYTNDFEFELTIKS